MNIIKEPYEISLWEDVLMYVGVPKEDKVSPTSNPEDLILIDYLYYTEKLLAIIGSDTMTSPARVVNPVFKTNINGTEILTFDIYYQYEENGEIIRNPLSNLIIDERKIKLKYENKWYDFIVKKDEEKGREYKYSYTCTGLAANELGKTGFSIELDTELENNTGTVQQLGEKILEGSDWLLSETGQEIINQTIEEALYSAVLILDITAKIRGTEVDKNIPSGARIYIYYTPFAILEEKYFLFIYVEGDTGLLIPDLLEDGITINCNNNRTFDLYLSNVEWEENVPNFINPSVTVADYRGLRYVKKLLSAYDPILLLTVLKYKGKTDNIEYYGYNTTKYIDGSTVLNYLYNSEGFVGTSYWGIYDSNAGNTNKSIQAIVFPNVTARNYSNGVQYLAVDFGGTLTSKLVNEGIIQNYSRINKFNKGDKYRIKLCAGTIEEEFEILDSLPFNFKIKKYSKIDVDTSGDITYFDSTDSSTVISKVDDYFYIDLICLNSASWNELKTNVGFYIILKNNTNIKYYIKDILFYLYIENENGEPMSPGDVPEVRVETVYYFYNPAENLGKIYADDYVFSDSDPNNYIALYGEGDKEFEKIRSITAKESNRFNLLLELSETFECWVKFEILHEENGLISIEDYNYYNLVSPLIGESAEGYYIYDWVNNTYVPAEGSIEENHKYYSLAIRKRLIKKVIFYGEILQDNYAGFKYGINLKDNNRTLDSEQIVTKIIVKDNNCEYAENGFCSIARANDNPIKENFIYNFDYYTSLGIINLNVLNNDLYLEINGSIGLYPKLSRINKERNNLIDNQAQIANKINQFDSSYLVASLTYNEAQKEILRMIDPKSGTIVLYTHYIYEDFFNLVERKGITNEIGILVPAYKNEIYYIAEDGLTDISTNIGGTLTFYKKTEDISPVEGVTYYYISGGVFTQLYTTKFRDGSIYYIVVDTTYEKDTYFLTDTNVNSLTFSNDGNAEVYVYNAARRRISDLGAEDFINDNFTISTLEKITVARSLADKAEKEMNDAKTELDYYQEEYDNIKNQLEEIAKASDEIEKEFNTKYSRYILEGSWTDDNYLDNDLYYLDSLSVLYLSAYPKITYNFSIIDLSQLDGYEPYKFEIAHKTYVEDTEFFGYKIIDGLRTPVRETVVVTESSRYLDEPDKHQLKIQNYKSHFEDLFQRITATTQNLEYHSGEYARAASAVNSNGTINEAVMQKTLANSNYIILNSKDLSVTWDDTGLLAVNLYNPLLITRLTSSGVLISADGGQTWGVAISGYGVNTNFLTAGVINADNINIMSGAWPTFKWDSLGLRAYGFTSDELGNIISYDPSRYVAHDKFGIYGINGLTNANFLSIQDVKDNAEFGLTWAGLFIKAKHRDGYVSIDSENDITLVELYTENDLKLERIRGKFGLLSSGDTNTLGQDVYGLALYDPNGQATVETKSDGTLWLKSLMDIGVPGRTNLIYIGVGLNATSLEIAKYNNHGKKVFSVKGDLDSESGTGGNTGLDRFTVYEDGFVTSNGSYISGPIQITEGGQIGNMTVAGLVDTVGIRITPSTGTFKVSGNTATPSFITFELKSGLEGANTYTWNYGPNPSSWSGSATGTSFTLNYNSSLFSSGITYVLVSTTINGITYSDKVSVSRVEDGEGGVTISSITYGLSSSASTEPSSWSPTVPTTINPGWWLWTRTTYDDGTTVDTKAYSGTNGQNGTSVTISSTLYGYNSSGTSHDNVIWGDNIPDVPQGDWLWIKVTYSDNTVVYSSTYMGTNGTNGTNGRDGTNGTDGTSYICSIETSLGNVINTDDLPSGTISMTVTGKILKFIGSNLPIDITSTATNWKWYKLINNSGSFSEISGATSSSFTYDLSGWDSVQFYFDAQDPNT